MTKEECEIETSKAIMEMRNCIADLEKENAELKEKCMELKRHFQNCDCALEIGQQLIKAKEHIENLLYYVKQCSCERSNYAEIEKDVAEAEQFLEECE